MTDLLMADDLDESVLTPEELSNTPESGKVRNGLELITAKKGLKRDYEELKREKDLEIQQLNNELNEAIRDKKCMRYCSGSEQVKRLKKNLIGYKVVKDSVLRDFEKDREERYRLEQVVRTMLGLVEDAEVDVDKIIKG